MSGQCYSCAASFGLFKKEHGCKSCGYAFCKDCLTKKAAIPKLNNEKHKVCNKCFSKLSGKTTISTGAAKYSPPEALRKLEAANREPKKAAPSSGPGPSVAAQNAKKYRGMKKEDIEIAQRLDKLKEGNKIDPKTIPSTKEMEDRLSKLKDTGKPPPPSGQEMAERLAKLKGQDPATANKPFVCRPDRRPEQQQVDDLLDEICDEVQIDSRFLPGGEEQGQPGSSQYQSYTSHPGSADFQNNLNLPGSGKSVSYNKNIPVSHEEEETVNPEQVNRLIQQVAREMHLDEQRALDGLKKDKELQDRLAKLKGQSSTANTGAKQRNLETDEEDEEEEMKKIIKRALEESKLEDELEASGGYKKSEVPNLPSVPGTLPGEASAPSKPTSRNTGAEEDGELPWCCICNSDATLRCQGCDGDLYCNRCYKEGHDREDYEDHPTVPYKKPKKPGNKS